MYHSSSRLLRHVALILGLLALLPVFMGRLAANPLRTLPQRQPIPTSGIPGVPAQSHPNGSNGPIVYPGSGGLPGTGAANASSGSGFPSTGAYPYGTGYYGPPLGWQYSGGFGGYGGIYQWSTSSPGIQFGGGGFQFNGSMGNGMQFGGGGFQFNGGFGNGTPVGGGFQFNGGMGGGGFQFNGGMGGGGFQFNGGGMPVSPSGFQFGGGFGNSKPGFNGNNGL